MLVLLLKTLLAAAVEFAHDLINELLVARHRVDVVYTTQLQCLIYTVFNAP